MHVHHLKLLTLQDSLPLTHWNGSPMLIHCLLAYYKHHHEDIDTLFQLLRVYTARHLTSYHFLTSYIENEVTKNFTIKEKRAIFFKFVEVFGNQDFPQELKAKVCNSLQAKWQIYSVRLHTNGHCILHTCSYIHLC